MGADTAIEWADHTFNPWIGCAKVSPACDHCYAEISTPARALGVAWGPKAARHRTSEATWRQPLAWNRKAQREGRRFKVFCASLADVFDNQVPIEWLVDLLDLIRTTPHLDWLLLTKRPQLIGQRMQMASEYLGRGVDRGDLLYWVSVWPLGQVPSHVWLGTTVENQAEADRRIPHLLDIPAAKRFLSCEPLLGPVALHDIRMDTEAGLGRADPLHGTFYLPGCGSVSSTTLTHAPRLHWIIAGGESGPKARPSHPDWFRSLRDQCQAAEVPFFFKQWGEFYPEDQPNDVQGQDWDRGVHLPNAGFAFRVGKKAAGATLDGREWREVPSA